MQCFVRAGKALLFCLAVGASTVAPRAAQAQQAPPTPARVAQTGQVAERLTWDANYLYLAFQVEDPNLAGTVTQPLGPAWEDDGVGVYLHVGTTNRPQAPDANTHAMIVSAAGGFAFLRGQNGTFVQRELRELITIKYAVTLQGTLNRADDRDQRYTIEMAIPWAVVGVTPGAQTVLGYNVVVRARGGSLASASANVRTEADVRTPAKWTRLTLQTGALQSGEQAAPRVGPSGRPPLIDGVLRTGEWSEAASYAFVAPERPAPPVAVNPVPVLPAEPIVLPPLFASPSLPLERLLMARYVLAFQGDPRKPIAFRGVRTAAGRFLLSDQPALGAGPWFSSDRTGWHQTQLSDMRRAGVDVALTVVGGPDADASRSDEKALLVLVQALREMAQERIAAPQLALWLDTQSLVPPSAPKPDLTEPEGRALLYRAVRRYFQTVPPELRARVQLPPEAGGASAYPVYLSTAAGFARLGKGWVEDLRRRFAADFGTETTLLVAGGEDWATSGEKLGAYLPLNGSGKGSGPVATYVVQPGFNDAAVAARGTLRSRNNGNRYRQAWEAALAAKPSWLILDSWNDFARGTEVAASRQYGSQYLDQTRIYALQFNGLQARDIKWLGHNAPRRMRPQQVVSVEVVFQNAGATPLRVADKVALAYRWLRNGKVVAEGPLRIGLAANLFPTQIARQTVGLAAVRVENETSGETPIERLRPLPPGEYTVQIDVTQTQADGRPVWFGENGDTPLSFPVTVTPEAAERVSFESTTTPTLLSLGESYPVSVRLRWLGSGPLPKEAALLTWQLLSADGAQTLDTGSIPLEQALPPGQMAILRTSLRLGDASGTLSPVFPEAQSSGYRLRWLLTRTQATEPIPGVYTERIALYPPGYQARVLVPPKTPTSMNADALVPVEVLVVNRGQTKWTKNELQVGYHWFYADGVEAVWKGGLTAPINKEVEPGGFAKIKVIVRAPERDGEYVLAFDVARGDDWLSTGPVTSTGDLGLAYVRVTGGRGAVVNLERFFNVDALAEEDAPGDGNLDGQGHTLPAESFPPDRYGLVALASQQKGRGPASSYPSGYYADVSPTARLISFRYAAQTRGANNALACEGQTIGVERGRYTGLHLAALATGGEARPLAVQLRYKDGSTETVSRAVHDWNHPPSPADQGALALIAHGKRAPGGDVGGVCAVRHIIVPVSVAKELVSVTLPSDRAIKVFAMTLER